MNECRRVKLAHLVPKYALRSWSQTRPARCAQRNTAARGRAVPVGSGARLAARRPLRSGNFAESFARHSGALRATLVSLGPVQVPLPPPPPTTTLRTTTTTTTPSHLTQPHHHGPGPHHGRPNAPISLPDPPATCVLPLPFIQAASRPVGASCHSTTTTTTTTTLPCWARGARRVYEAKAMALVESGDRVSQLGPLGPPMVEMAAGGRRRRLR